MSQDNRENSYSADNIMLEKIRKMSTAERFTITRRLTARFMQRIRREIARQNPGRSKDALALIFVERLYGEKLADQLKEYFKRIEFR